MDLGEQSRIKLLLASIIRRAAYDIALYKDHPHLVYRKVAVNAMNWMFTDEVPEEKIDRFTSFRQLCEILDLNPDKVRKDTLELKKDNVMRISRGHL